MTWKFERNIYVTKYDNILLNLEYILSWKLLFSTLPKYHFFMEWEDE